MRIDATNLALSRGDDFPYGLSDQARGKSAPAQVATRDHRVELEHLRTGLRRRLVQAKARDRAQSIATGDADEKLIRVAVRG